MGGEGVREVVHPQGDAERTSTHGPSRRSPTMGCAFCCQFRVCYQKVWSWLFVDIVNTFVGVEKFQCERRELRLSGHAWNERA
jgi:hypothetical protein